MKYLVALCKTYLLVFTVIELKDKIYIIEFKFATNKRIKKVTTLAQKALRQIHGQGYFEPYLTDGRPIYLVGMGFLNKQIAVETEVLERS